MTHVVTENCDGCRFTDCVTTCPVACFHGDALRMYLAPDTCIDCGACIPACPVRAIVKAIDLAKDQRHWLAINAEKVAQLPVITKRQTPLPTAETRRQALGY